MFKQFLKLTIFTFFFSAISCLSATLTLSDWDYSDLNADSMIHYETPHVYTYNKELPNDFSYIKITYKNFSFDEDFTGLHLFASASSLKEKSPTVSLFYDYEAMTDMGGNIVSEKESMGLSSSYLADIDNLQSVSKSIDVPTDTKDFAEVAFSFELNSATSYTISLWLNGTLFGTETIDDANLNLIPENLILSFANNESIEKISDISFSKVAVPEPSTYAIIFGTIALGAAIYRRLCR